MKHLHQLGQYLKSDGTLAVFYQPREKGATDETAIAEGDTYAKYLREAGYTQICVFSHTLKPISAAAVTAMKPS